MFTLILLTLFLGIIGGFLFLALVLLKLFKIKCPKCKQLRPVRQIVLLEWKTQQIIGQPCLKCQTIKTKVNIF